uniref:uncharacterized protein LOC122610227 n=1 Tax=Erigeron canadensis TaxID=72917 RepID=UPI001CB9D047|nr:uncharacterized protein LOC122610227 [Erigeron canadensis]
MARQIREQRSRNPGIPTKALQEELEQKLQISVYWMKAFRAKTQASTDNKGDFHTQFSLLRDYCEELKLQNPGTTIKIEVERSCNPEATTRQFKRIYVCIGALKEGWKECMRDLIGLDGAFMRGPYPGQVLTAVGVDSNNGIYPVAFAVVEAETRDSWTWFLECLGLDLELESHYNFTFISDRQKGLIQAIGNVFPSAEHRYCVKHIHENMKHHWRGKLYKDIFWRCATATTVPGFKATMAQMKRLNVDAYNWLRKIDPQHWSRSHFSGRCKSDMLLNNLCECLNGQIVLAREKPIIGCLDFIRGYLMKRIVLIQKVIDKSKGPLTPAAMDLMKVIEKEANECKVTWNGGVKYQVNAPWSDQHIVDTDQMSCTCRKWELSGLPCKHAYAVNWDMNKFGRKVGKIESWAHRCYWLDTWMEAYSFKVNPVTGTTTWPKSTCPIGLTPPIHHTPVGRPKKKRKRGLYEDEPLSKEGKLSRKIHFGRCTQCGNKGHNARTCKGQPGVTNAGVNNNNQQARSEAGVNLCY